MHTRITTILAPVLTSTTLAGGPAIEITSTPTYGVEGCISGNVSGVDFATHCVAPLILVEGLGWWTKPTFENPTVPINPDGTFVAAVATGGLDDRATIFFAALVPAGVTPPIACGAACLPSFDGLALAVDSVERFGRTVSFAGCTWGVKEAPLPVGPGPNLFSFDRDDVWVDGRGHLHLTITFDGRSWRSTEVVLLDRPGYGTYWFSTASRLDLLDPNATFAGFTWDSYCTAAEPANPHRELDFEDSRWGNAGDPTNAQFVKQPYTAPGNLRRYTIPDLSDDAALTRFFTWHPCQVHFTAVRGETDPFTFAPEDVIDEFVYDHGTDPERRVPDEGRAAFRFNLWLNQPEGPLNGEPIEVVITSFGFVRDGECRWDVDGSGAVDVGDLVMLLGDWGACSATTDFDRSGAVDTNDLIDLLAHWGACP